MVPQTCHHPHFTHESSEVTGGPGTDQSPGPRPPGPCSLRGGVQEAFLEEVTSEYWLSLKTEGEQSGGQGGKGPSLAERGDWAVAIHGESGQNAGSVGRAGGSEPAAWV